MKDVINISSFKIMRMNYLNKLMNIDNHQMIKINYLMF